METSKFLEIMKKIQNSLLEFVDNEASNDDLFQNLIKILDEQQITGNKHVFKSTLYIISSIANDHHRNLTFFSKIEQILLNYKEIIKIDVNLPCIIKCMN